MFIGEYLRGWDELGGKVDVRIKGRYDLDSLVAALNDPAIGLPTIGLPVQFDRDQIQYGNLFRKTYEDCVVLKNADHPDDYFYFVFTARTTGNLTTLGIYRAGSSVNHGQENKKAERMGRKTLVGAIAGALTKTDKQGLEAEEDYYALVIDTIRTVLSF